MNAHQFRTRKVTMAAVFAAVYFVLRSIPTFQMVGVSGRFTAGDFLLTSIALIAGVWSGSLSVIAGTVLACAVSPPLFFGLDFLPGLVNVAVVGLILAKRLLVAQAVYVAVLLAFVISPYSLLFGYGLIPYVWLHLVALIILLSPLPKTIPDWLTRGERRQIAAIALLAFFGTMAQHLTGGLLYEATAGFVGGINPLNFHQFWRIIFWIYPTERLVVVVISTVIALALLKSTIRLIPKSPKSCN